MTGDDVISLGLAFARSVYRMVYSLPSREEAEAKMEERRLDKALMGMEDRNISRSRLAEMCGSADNIGTNLVTNQPIYRQRGWANPDPNDTLIMPLYLIEEAREILRRSA